MITNEVSANRAISDRAGWAIWWRALKISKYGSLGAAAEWMYKLNVLARSLGMNRHYEERHPIVDQIYKLKDALIQYLYECGYATEVRESFQNRPCRTCDGSGEYYTGEMCYRCSGTGIYATTKLYAFRFCVDGKPYAWHQLQKLVDYPVTLTDAESVPFRKPAVQDEYITLQDAWLGCCVVWWALLLHGTMADLLLFSRIKTFTWQVRMKFKRFKEERMTTLLISVIALVMIFGCIFWHPILTWIWCNIFKRCVDGVPF